MQPKIVAHVWGRIDVAQEGGARTSFKDARLWPGGAREWDWAELGTRHDPGIGIAEAESLAREGVSAVVLSRGVHEQLLVPEETVRWLEGRGIRTHVLQTDQAVACYNALVDAGERVGALIHSTC